ncbi:hypothetical protein [Streptomyces poriticola]|uniref:hypothetical protein n=1 Tax=Streptomyces poriticola TaxID=3120506 RepID=UPI002FCDE734
MKAIELYKKCLEVWPESIETRYRLVAAYINYGMLEKGRERSQDWKMSAKKEIRELEKSLGWRKSRLRWLRGFRPGRVSLGERRYWASWLRHRRPGCRFGRSKRKLFLRAVRVMKKYLEAVDDSSECPLASMNKFMTEKRWVPGAGWMAHYNAACFYSHMIKRGDAHVEACVEQALIHLGKVVRNPLSEPNRLWTEVDPSLDPLRSHPKGREFMKIYMGRNED